MPPFPRASALALSTLVLLGLAMSAPFVHGQDSQATVSISGPSKVADTATSVDVSVNVANAQNLGAFQFILTVDSDLLHPVSAANADFLSSTGREISCPDPTIDAASIHFLCVTLRDTPAGADGSGTLAVVTLKPAGKGTSDIRLSHVKLVHPDGSELPTTTVDGKVSVGSTGGNSSAVWWIAGIAGGAAIVVALVAGVFVLRRRSASAGASDLGGPSDLGGAL